ncbi:MAG: 50S ribosomal protein L11 methyltransferase [Pseudomonadota bacterium]
MASFSALTTVRGAEAAQALGESLELLNPEPTGIGVFEVEDGSGLWEVGGYFTEKPDVAGLALITALHGAADFAVSRIEDRDWVAQVRRELHPVHAGRFTVFGAHDSHRVGVNRIGLKIEAAMAFGTGHHGTTRGCLELFERMLRQGYRPSRVADIGCGTAVLAMAAARTCRIPVVATDIDPVATATALENVRANMLGPWVRTACAVGFRHEVLRDAAPLDLVFANILAGPLKRMAPDMARHIRPGGHAILAGLMTPQARNVSAVFRGFGLVPVDRISLGEWTSLRLRRLRK